MNEVRGEIGFCAEIIIQCVPCGVVGRDSFSVVGGIPTELCGTVRTVEKLLGRFVEVLAPLVGNVKFDGCGTSDFHISD